MSTTDFLVAARAVLIGLVAVAVVTAESAAETFYGVDLEHGDLIFVRGVDDIVLYEGARAETSEDLWAEARSRVLAADRRAAAIESWNYDDFVRHFTEDVTDPSSVEPMSGSQQVSVGHVAIFAFDESGAPFIFEAAGIAEGVRRLNWHEWKAKTVGDSEFWITRLIFEEDQINSVVEKALRYDKAPYDITNRDLADTSSFYCSKLVWLAVKQATGVAMDGNPNGNRYLWYSPRQLLESDFLFILASSTNESFSGFKKKEN